MDSPSCCLKSPSNKRGYSLLTLRSIQETFGGFYQTRQYFIFLTVFVCSLTTLLLSFISCQNYKPYRNLKNALMKTGLITDNVAQARSKIFQAIQTLDLLTQHNRLLDKQIIREQYTSRSMLLNRLINNQYDKIDILKHRLENYHVTLNSAFYTVCIFRLSGKTDENFFLDNPLYFAAYPDCRIYCTTETDLRLHAIIGSVNGMFPANTVLLYPQEKLNILQHVLQNADYLKVSPILNSLRHQLSQDSFSYSMLKTICYEAFNIIYREYRIHLSYLPEVEI